MRRKFSQVTHQPSKYTYVEFGLKNHTGSVKDRSEGKVVLILSTVSPSCHVLILDTYLDKFPREDISPDSKFYFSPLPFTPTGSRLWFFSDPFPRRKLQNLIKEICHSTGVEGNFTSHSLCATGTTALFDGDIPESIIQKRTGHRSLDRLWVYEE